jgi:DNA-binding NtrC family response regulator
MSSGGDPAGGPMPLLTVQTPLGPPVTCRCEGSVVSIGRAPSNDVVIRLPDVSRYHLELRATPGGWIAADLGSSNGTTIHGRPLVGQEPIADGDELGLGPVRIRFSCEGETAGAAALERRSLPDDGLVGESPSLRVIRDGLPRVAASMASVLVTGESGTGKELVAQALHRLSPRGAGPFVVVNCPTLRGSLLETELFGVEAGVATGVAARPGRLEKADGGTIFLDEVGDLDLVAQAMLLRFLQDHSIERIGGRRLLRLDVRIVAATNRDLEADVRQGTFRQDLLHRLDVVSLRLPPLRERRDDLPALIDHFLQREEGRRARLSPEARRALLEHDYPGNVRQLEHALESAMLLAGGALIRLDHLPASFRRTPAASVVGGSERSVEAQASSLLAAMASGASFWDVVREPYLRRELSRDVVREVIRQARRRAGRAATMRDAARVLGIEAQHKKLLNFLWSHRLRDRDAEDELAPV